MAYCQTINIHICSQCDGKAYHSQKKLDEHIRANHNNTRTINNLSLCTKHIQGDLQSGYAPSWRQGLQFIDRHMEPEPSNFRAGVTEKIKPELLHQFDDIMAGIITAYSIAATEYVGDITQRWNTRSDVFLWLLFHTEMLILGPQRDAGEPNKAEAINKGIARRLEMFRCGHLQPLWAELKAVKSRKPGTPKPFDRDQTDMSVQDAADKNNLSSAYARACKPQLIATIDSNNLCHVQDKYPQRRYTRGFGQATSHLPPPHPTYHIPITPPDIPGDIIDSIRRQNRGKANGCFMDSLDFFIRLVNRESTDLNKAIRILFRRIYHGHIDSRMVPYFTNTYLFCLHKDEADPTKLRPIGIPTALRRIIANHVARVFRHKFAMDLLPFNFAVGVDSGMDFIVKSSQLAVEKYITIPQNEGRAPSRVFISLDLVNMFNELSRDTVFEIITTKYPELLPLVRMLYAEPGMVFFRMADGSWNKQMMEEGANQGCPLSATLAELVLNEILRPLDEKLKERARQRKLNGNMMDDGCGGETHPMGYIDDCGSAVVHADALFFLREFERLADIHGFSLNSLKTRLLTSTNGTSAIDAIEREFGAIIANKLRRAIADYSVEEIKPTDIDYDNPPPYICEIGFDEVERCPALTTGTRTTPSRPVEVVTGLRLLGQPIGSSHFAKHFFQRRLQENLADANKLLEVVSNHHTALTLFAKCTLHKLPHLLASEVVYHLHTRNYTGWDDWNGYLATCIDNMVNAFLSQLTCSDSIPLASLMISYIKLSHGGLGLMDAHTRAIPDFVLSMSQATRYAIHGFTFNKNDAPFYLPLSLSALFYISSNPSSVFLSNFNGVLGDVALAGTHTKCNNPVAYFLEKGSLHSARDRLKTAASERRLRMLPMIAGDDLKPWLSETLIASSSYAIIGMSRSIPYHRRPNDLFMINLKMKLHLPLFAPPNLPKCLCGKNIDVHGMHTFHCKHVSKMAMHDRVVREAAPIICKILQTCGIIGPGSSVSTEPRRLIEALPGLCPLDSFFGPTPNLKNTTISPIPYTKIGFDFTFTSPKGHLPPSRRRASKNPAPAAQHLIDAEKKKLCRVGASNALRNITWTGDEIIGALIKLGIVLIPVAISPHGRWGHMFHNFLFGKLQHKQTTFVDTRPNAARMYQMGMRSPCPTGVIPHVTNMWKKSKPKTQQFFGNSYTVPTPTEYALQQLGLIISNATACHLRDAKLGKLVPPTDPLDENYNPDLLAASASTHPQPPIASLAAAPTSVLPPSPSLDHDNGRFDFTDAASLWNGSSLPPSVGHFQNPAPCALAPTPTFLTPTPHTSTLHGAADLDL